MIKRIGILSFLVFFMYNTIWAVQSDCYSQASTGFNLAELQYGLDLENCSEGPWTSVCNREAERKFDAAIYQIGLDLDDFLKSVPEH